MKFLFIILFLFSQGISDDDSRLNQFELGLKKESSQYNITHSSNTSSDSSNDNNGNMNSCNSDNEQDYHHSPFSNRHRHRKSPISRFFDFLDVSAFVGSLAYHAIVKPLAYIVSSPFSIPMKINDYEDIPLTFDKYPFYSTNGIYNKDGKSQYLNAEFSSFKFDDSVYGNKAKVNYQFSGKWGVNYSYVNLKEKNNSSIINKYMNNFMFTNIFSSSDSFGNNQNIDFSYGIGYSNWIGNEYKESGLKMEYGIRAFLNPISLNLNLGYSFIDNGILDLNACASYHYKRYSLNLGLQTYITDDVEIGGKTFSISYWF